MSSTVPYYRPSSSCNWAEDDDEDDFDFDTWKAKADTSAPTAAEMGPLQHTLSKDEDDVYTTEAANATTATPAAPPARDEAMIAQEVQWAQNTLVCRALMDVADVPAYPEMSYAHFPSEFNAARRVSYSSNWGHYKVDIGFDCGFTLLFRASRLRVVYQLDEMKVEVAPYLENVEALEKFSEIDIKELPAVEESDGSVDTWERSESGSESEFGSDKENVAPLVDIPVSAVTPKRFVFDDITDGVTTEEIRENDEFAFEDLFEDEFGSKTDEGYHSATPPFSPTEEFSGDELEAATNPSTPESHPAVEYSRRDCTNRHGSIDTLVVFRNELADSETAVDVFEDNESAVPASESAHSDVGFGGQSSEVLELSAWPLPSAFDDSNDENVGNKYSDSELSSSQQAHNTYLSKPEPSSSTITKPEIVIVNDEPLEATDLPVTLLSTSPILAKVDALPSAINTPKPVTSRKGLVSSAILKVRYLFSLLPGVTAIVRGVHGLLGRVRAILHRC